MKEENEEFDLSIDCTEKIDVMTEASKELIALGLIEPAKGYLNQDVSFEDCFMCFETNEKILKKATPVYLYKARFSNTIHLLNVKRVSLISVSDTEMQLEVPTASIDWNFYNDEYSQILDKYDFILGKEGFCEFFYDYLENVHNKSE